MGIWWYPEKASRKDSIPCPTEASLIYAMLREAVFWTGVVEVHVIHTYSPFVPLRWDNHHVGQPFRVFNCSDKSVLQNIIDLGLDDQVAIWVKASHFLSNWLGGWCDV